MIQRTMIATIDRLERVQAGNKPDPNSPRQPSGFEPSQRVITSPRGNAVGWWLLKAVSVFTRSVHLEKSMPKYPTLLLLLPTVDCATDGANVTPHPEVEVRQPIGIDLREDHTYRVGDYRIAVSNEDPLQYVTVTRRGTRLWASAEEDVLDFIPFWTLISRPMELTGNGIDDLYLMAWTGGANCCGEHPATDPDQPDALVCPTDTDSHASFRFIRGRPGTRLRTDDSIAARSHSETTPNRGRKEARHDPSTLRALRYRPIPGTAEYPPQVRGVADSDGGLRRRRFDDVLGEHRNARSSPRTRRQRCIGIGRSDKGRGRDNRGSGAAPFRPGHASRPGRGPAGECPVWTGHRS